MEGKTITLISETGKGFFETTMKTAFEEDKFKVHTASYIDQELESLLDDSDAYMILLNNTIREHSHFLTQIKKKSEDNCCKIFLYGTKDDNFEARNKLSDDVIADTFVRPLTNKEVIDGINSFFGMQDTRNRLKRVLVVDDSGMMLRTILGWLEGKYLVSLANSAANAFREMQKNKPDLILLDYEMPVCSGAQFMEMLGNEEDSKDIPVVFLTARDDKETVSEVLKLKPAGYLLKTTPEKVVVQFIDNYFISHGLI